ncbi:MAG: shikimate kinase [Chloroflexota bacterium]
MNDEENEFNIVLTGFMGTGKSTVGKVLAQKLSFEFVDTDILIEETSGRSIPEIFEQSGEGHFRDLERNAAIKLAQHARQVISTGGRMMLDAHNVEALSENSQIFCLSASPEEIYRRVTSDKNGIERPLLNGSDPKAKISKLLQERKALYLQFAQIDTENRTPEEIANEILAQLPL